MYDSPKTKKKLDLIVKAKSSEINRDDMIKDPGMIQAVTRAAGKGSSSRSNGSASSPRNPGRGRASSLSRSQTAEELCAIALAAGSAT